MLTADSLRLLKITAQECLDEYGCLYVKRKDWTALNPFRTMPPFSQRLESDMNTPNNPRTGLPFTTTPAKPPLAQLHAIDADKDRIGQTSYRSSKVVSGHRRLSGGYRWQIQARAIATANWIPGVVVKDSVVPSPLVRSRSCRATSPQETIGDKAFSKRELLSPAQMTSWATKGKSFVAVASFKPEAGQAGGVTDMIKGKL